MGRLTISLPENVMAVAEAQAAKAGLSVDEYVAELILATAGRPIRPELEAELLKGLESPAREFSAAAWAIKRGEHARRLLSESFRRLSRNMGPRQWTREDLYER